MAGERTSDGFRIRLKPHGIGRFFGAAFLTVWLCGWAAGEAFALWFLGTGLAALLTGGPPRQGAFPAESGPALAIGAFLVLWLALWTYGGVAAMREWLRLLWAEDRILAYGAGITVVRHRGPFRIRKEYPRDAIHGFVLTTRHSALALEMDRERVELSRLGTLAEREEARNQLRTELALGESPAGLGTEAPAAALPHGWEEIITPEGERAIVQDRRTRKTQARVAGALALVVAAAALAAARGSLESPALIPGAILALFATLGLSWGTMWLLRGRMEWRIGSGRITLRRRFGSRVRDEFEAERLELTVTRDSDGDEWFALEGVRGSEAGLDPARPMEVARHARKNRRRIASALHDPAVPMRLGAWLSRAAGLPLEDRSTPEARRMEIAVLKGQLEASGPVGKFAARLIEKVEARRAGKG